MTPKCQAVARHCTWQASYNSDSDRHLAGLECTSADAITQAACLAIERQQVAVDPETQRHVGIEDQVCDCTTRYVCVVVDVALGICNLGKTTDRIYDHTLNAIRGTARNVDEQIDKQ